MSLNARHGHTFRYEPTSKKPPDWQLNLFCLFFFLPIALAFAAGGWCLILARAISRPDRQ